MKASNEVDYLNPALSDSTVDPAATAKLQPSSEEDSNFVKDLTETAKLIIDRRMLLVEPLILQTALGIAVQAAIMVPQMSLVISETKPEWDSAKTNQFCLLAMVGLGIGEIIGA